MNVQMLIPFAYASKLKIKKKKKNTQMTCPFFFCDMFWMTWHDGDHYILEDWFTNKGGCLTPPYLVT